MTPAQGAVILGTYYEDNSTVTTCSVFGCTASILVDGMPDRQYLRIDQIACDVASTQTMIELRLFLSDTPPPERANTRRERFVPGDQLTGRRGLRHVDVNYKFPVATPRYFNISAEQSLAGGGNGLHCTIVGTFLSE